MVTRGPAQHREVLSPSPQRPEADATRPPVCLPQPVSPAAAQCRVRLFLGQPLGRSPAEHLREMCTPQSAPFSGHSDLTKLELC